MQNKLHAAVGPTARQEIHHTPARQVVRPTGGIFRGRFPSRKSGRSVAFESLIERDALLLFEFSRGIASYREQPYSIWYLFDGKSRRYTPDFELTLISGTPLVIEIKPEEKTLIPDEARRLRRIHEHLASLGVAFRVLTDTQIRTGSRLSNLGTLLPYLGKPMSALQRRLAAEPLRENSSPLTVAHASRCLGSTAEVYRLIAEDVLGADLHQRLSDSTALFIQDRDPSDEELYF
ncbi:TnsA endonuclease N-terminal domain-containing protein [Burkholderia cenocepacia]|uniref:TnsA endonuclease N-terminal domain-containing protein n=1 Tax=Burkholderia cenocepacia TaxID=95486 RepID=UPI0023B9097A|nr:TnsA endonuclease N-terminal domain-containing protein [Burkholderia cenocepacia]MDF0499980.1 TnsA endonuclease N-terminal domain-containing protein [Burkholderia cenocepacia]